MYPGSTWEQRGNGNKKSGSLCATARSERSSRKHLFWGRVKCLPFVWDDFCCCKITFTHTYRVSQKKVYNRIFWGRQPDRRRSCCTLLPAPCSSTPSSKRLCIESTITARDSELNSLSRVAVVASNLFEEEVEEQGAGRSVQHDLRRSGCQPQKILL